MLNLPTMADLKTAAENTTDPILRTLLANRLADTIQCGLQEYTHVLVIEAEDSEAGVIEAIGFSPLEARIEGTRNSADWDWIEHHEGWWELLYTAGNDGFAYIVLVADDDRSPLALLCRSEGGGR